jgi:hypothetical protein
VPVEAERLNVSPPENCQLADSTSIDVIVQFDGPLLRPTDILTRFREIRPFVWIQVPEEEVYLPTHHPVQRQDGPLWTRIGPLSRPPAPVKQLKIRISNHRPGEPASAKMQLDISGLEIYGTLELRQPRVNGS